MKSGRKNSFTDLNNMNKYALFKVAHFQTNEKLCRKGRAEFFIYQKIRN